MKLLRSILSMLLALQLVTVPGAGLLSAQAAGASNTLGAIWFYTSNYDSKPFKSDQVNITIDTKYTTNTTEKEL